MKTDVHPLQQLDGCMNTFTGKKVNLLSPKKEQIEIFDISKGLANKGYFSGQTPKFFSIAQHCVMVCNLMPRRFQKKPDLMLTALLHDASEAYTGDMIKPLKVLLPKFREIEDNLQATINEAFGLNWDYMKTIKPYDKKAQQICYEAFFKKIGYVDYLSPEEAEALFMNRYWKYTNELEKYKK